jgi:fused signal recognition particle receptor
MDPSTGLNPSDLFELLGVVGGVGATGLLGYLLVRAQRRARRRQIEGVDAPTALAPEAPEPETEALPARRESPRAAEAAAARARRAAAPAPAEEPPTDEPLEPQPEVKRAPAQIIPFPVPAAAPPAEAPPVEAPPAEAPPVKRRGAGAAALAPGLARTRSGFVARLGDIFKGRKELDPSVVGDIEKVLLTADIGVRTSQNLLEEIRSSLSRRELADPDAVWAFLRRRSSEMLSLPAPPVDFTAAQPPFVLLIIGVNGSGKTTTIGKLAAKLAADGKKVLLAAGDTFRAAAVEQLDVWAGRAGATLVRGKEGVDPSSVIFDGVKRGVTEGFDVVIADTAGRLHTKTDLMQELQKVRRVVGKACPGAPHETWLVIDSTSGQNAIAQAQIFTEAMSVSGIVLTKLDGTAKGGVILGITDQLKLPVRYIGIGEKVDDLRAFDPDDFVDALFAPPEHSN